MHLHNTYCGGEMSHVKNQKNSIRGNTVQYNTIQSLLILPIEGLVTMVQKLDNYNSKNVLEKNQRN